MPRRKSDAWTLARRALAVVAATAALGGGCASELSLRAPDYDVRNARIVFMPAMVALYRIDVPHREIFDEQLSKGARTRVDVVLRSFAAHVGSRIASLTEVAGTELTSDEFYSLMDHSTYKIVADWAAHPTRTRPLSAWNLGSRLASWEPALHADYVVFIWFKGGYETAERQNANLVASLVGGQTVTGRRRAILSVVDLHAGRIVRMQSTTFEDLHSLDEIRLRLSELVAALGR